MLPKGFAIFDLVSSTVQPRFLQAELPSSCLAKTFLRTLARWSNREYLAEMLRCWSCLEQFDVQTARIFFDARVVPCDKPANLSRSIGHDQLAAMMILHQLLIVELWQTKMICKHSELIDSSSKNLIYSQKSFTRLLCTAHSGDDRMLAGESPIVETVSMSRPRGWGAGGSGGEANISWSTDQMTRPTYQIKPT